MLAACESVCVVTRCLVFVACCVLLSCHDSLVVAGCMLLVGC